ncbi:MULTISPECIES: C-GCAxxG-C-C family (seleno)protein [unclassified Oceanispirochaeta]|uniref:C-GCAxxG-C-C family (seleno)protein n=1 Tax=unclassified Oceanispirochaeta TaxID=2635722 RepID=UPI000E0946B5|nr:MULTISPECIES: C-GCAxxG-C-C family (seleno)protein [unclassified Oceanispirochaeta]MBF9014238.1 C-GCAxxG-C-C family protein [Oceanispirochaeta sp. M2]NPD71124.1 hypothetical protein [Oceanispirochaeta sp. M1]RDG33518.1 hypothetical protein DV872_03335 [Oceanispirochaeta sp. M1]
MKREESVLNHFKHKNRKLRINCAQAILKTYDPNGLVLDSELVIEFKKHGHGKAPNKYCGAYYAASYLLEIHHPDKMEDFANWFRVKSGDLVCRKIRKARQLSCSGCVEQAALYLNDVFPEYPSALSS